MTQCNVNVCLYLCMSVCVCVCVCVPACVCGFSSLCECVCLRVKGGGVTKDGNKYFLAPLYTHIQTILVTGSVCVYYLPWPA